MTNALTMGINKWRLCQALYDGLEYKMKTLLESMCQGGILKKKKDERWLLYEDLADKTINGNQLRKNLGLTTLALLKKVPIPLRQTRLLKLN